MHFGIRKAVCAVPCRAGVPGPKALYMKYFNCIYPSIIYLMHPHTPHCQRKQTSSCSRSVSSYQTFVGCEIGIFYAKGERGEGGGEPTEWNAACNNNWFLGLTV